MKAFAVLVLTVTVPFPATVIGVPIEPISPLAAERFIVVPAVNVKAPERVIVPEPLA